MKLAERIIVTLAGEHIELRPTLADAIRLERRPGSFRQLLIDVQDESLTAAVAIIGSHTDMPFLSNRVFDVLPTLRDPLLAYIMACAGIDPDDAPANQNQTTRKTTPFSEYLANLYRIGTGWLGWTPKDTLDATPVEILEAYKGRLELLKAVFGNGESTPAKDERPLDEKFRSIFAGIGTRKEAA